MLGTRVLDLALLGYERVLLGQSGLGSDDRGMVVDDYSVSTGGGGCCEAHPGRLGLESGDGVFHAGSLFNSILLCFYGDVVPDRGGGV